MKLKRHSQSLSSHKGGFLNFGNLAKAYLAYKGYRAGKAALGAVSNALNTAKTAVKKKVHQKVVKPVYDFIGKTDRDRKKANTNFFEKAKSTAQAYNHYTKTPINLGNTNEIKTSLPAIPNKRQTHKQDWFKPDQDVFFDAEGIKKRKRGGIIKKVGQNDYMLLSHKTKKKLAEGSLSQVKKRERQINYFKHKNVY